MNGVNGWRGIRVGWRMCVCAEVSASLERLSYVLYVTGLYVFERDRETVVINSWEVIRLLIKTPSPSRGAAFISLASLAFV